MSPRVELVLPPPSPNLLILQKATSEVAYLVPTATGMQKAIMDAVAPARVLLRDAGYHDYEHQAQGVIRRESAVVVTDDSNVPVTVSLYRPRTKDGDPRIWIERLGRFARAGETLALVVVSQTLHIINLSTTDLANPRSNAAAFVQRIRATAEAVAQELLGKIKLIARAGCIPAVGHGSTAVGRTLENALGIKINSSKTPDYKGIELKSARDIAANRKTLFAQVPEWKLGSVRSSADILTAFGYARGGVNKLYVTVKTDRANSQGLQLQLDERRDWLLETSNNPSYKIVAVWPLDSLRQRLRTKHAETFWIDAKEMMDVDGQPCFVYERILHTKQPVVTQLEPLIAAGHITVDHLIKRQNGRVSEKGPLFKISRSAIPLLFPQPETYEL
jgi:hypothetical protein